MVICLVLCSLTAVTFFPFYYFKIISVKYLSLHSGLKSKVAKNNLFDSLLGMMEGMDEWLSFLLDIYDGSCPQIKSPLVLPERTLEMATGDGEIS